MNNGERIFPKYLTWKNTFRVLAFVLAALLLAALFLTLVPKSYAATARVFVNIADSEIYELSDDFVYGSKNLAASYNNYLTTDFLVETAHSALPKQYADRYSAAQLNGMISTEVVRQTNTIAVTITAPNESDARFLSDFYTDFAFDYLISLTGAGTYTIYENGATSDIAVLPYRGLTLMAGAGLGMLLAVLYTLLERYTDFDIETVKELEKAAPQVAILGVIPSYDGEDTTKKLVLAPGASVSDMLLQNGFFVAYTKGTSMLPLLKQGRDSVIIVPVDRRLHRGDIVLYKRQNGDYLLHRIVKRGKGGTFVMRGDNQKVKEPGIKKPQIIGVATAIYRGDKRISLKSPRFWLYNVFWLNLPPVRKICRFAGRAAARFRRLWRESE